MSHATVQNSAAAWQTPARELGGSGRSALGRRIWVGCALALALLACAPAASGELCGRSLHADSAEYVHVSIWHELSEGTFRGFCANQEYGVFGVFLDAGPGEDLDLIMPKSEFDPEQFDYPSCSFGYGVNGGSSAHPGIHAEQTGQTDRTRTISLSWDVPVSQISYLRSPVECVEKRAAVDHLSGAPAAFPLWSGGELASCLV